MAKTSWRKGIPLKPSIQEQLRKVISIHGEHTTAEAIGVGVVSVVRAAAGLGLRRGTAFVIETKLASMTRAA
jgi:hypothetical protein